jgi:hypothetical protein
MKGIFFGFLFLLNGCDDWPKAVSANFAKEVCSCIFVVGQTQNYCSEYHEQIFKVSAVEIDSEKKEVVAVGLGIQSVARFKSERHGCQLIE